MKMATNHESANESPWPKIKDDNLTSAEICFEDSFTGTNEHNLNQNGLQLPDSSQYLSILETKLNKKKYINPAKELSNREFVKSLTAKRDALFQQEFESPSNEFDDISETNRSHIISSLITNTALFNALEKRVSPQSQALDPQELQKLIDADLLNLIRDLETKTEPTEEKKS